ncbi:hypothetical protein PO909_004017 [Leuciscus waleckii]
MASKTEVLLLLVAVMITSYGLTNASDNATNTTNATSTTNTTSTTKAPNNTAASPSLVGMVGLPGLLIYTLTSTALLELFQLI